MGLFDFLKKKKKPEAPSAPRQEAPAPKPRAVQPPAPKPQPAPQPAAPSPAKAWEPPKPAPRTELGEQLKRRYIEFDINGSAEQLTPYFDEALAALRDHGDDPHAFYWGCRTVHEMLRPPMAAFRGRIGEVAALEPVQDRVAQLQLDAIRYNQPDPELNGIVAANLKALTGVDMAAQVEDARRFNAAWIEFAGKAGKFPGSMTESEREKFEGEVCGICARLNSCSAVNRIVDVTVQIMRAVHQAQQFGNTVSVTTVDLNTGAQETSRNPTLYEAEDFGVRMIAALPREALEQCLEGGDFSIDPADDRDNYNVLLRRAASRAGLNG